MEDEHSNAMCVDMYAPTFSRLPLSAMLGIFMHSESTISFSPSHIYM